MIGSVNAFHIRSLINISLTSANIFAERSSDGKGQRDTQAPDRTAESELARLCGHYGMTRLH